MATQTFELVSPFMTIWAPSRTWIGDSNQLLGQTAENLVPGEFLELDSTGVGVTRGSAAAGAASSKPAFAYFSETGRGDIITGGKIPILMFGPYEADTMVFERSGNTVANGHDNFVVGDALCVDLVANTLTGTAGKCKGVAKGIVAHDGSSYNVGYVSRIIGTGAAQKVRILVGVYGG